MEENNAIVRADNNEPQYLEQANSLIDNVNCLTGQLTTLASTAENLAGMYAQCMEIRNRTIQIEKWSEVQMAQTIAKYKLCQQFLESSFGERNQALQKHYELLDKAINGGDKELILASLRGIGNIVTTSPLEDLEKFAEVFNDTSQPLLDF